MLSLFRLLPDWSEKLHLHSFSSLDKIPSTIYSASLNQLKRLIIAYFTVSPRLSINTWFSTVIIQVGNAMIKDSVNNPHWRFHFRLYFEFWKEACVRHRVFCPIPRAVLSSALRTSVIDGALANSMLEELQTVARHHDAPEVAVTAFIFNFLSLY